MEGFIQLISLRILSKIVEYKQYYQYNSIRREGFMGYYENIAACRTEKELLELWKAKEPVTKTYMEKKQQ